MHKFIVIILLSFVFLFPKNVFAALYINEFSSSGSSDWVEIYNSDSSSVDLSNYIVKDSSTNTHPMSGSIEGNSFVSFDWNDNLNNNGDTIKLTLNDNVIDEVVYGANGTAAPTGSQTAGRIPDGSSTWTLFTNATKGSTNNSPTVAPTPTPSPTPSPSPTPTKTPTPTPTPTKAPTPTPIQSGPTPTPATTPKTTATPIPTIDPNREGGTESATFDQPVEGHENILGNSTGFDNLQSGISEDKKTYSWGKLFILMGVVLVGGACGILLYNNYRKQKDDSLASGS